MEEALMAVPDLESNFFYKNMVKLLTCGLWAFLVSLVKIILGKLVFYLCRKFHHLSSPVLWQRSPLLLNSMCYRPV
ncbi:hypothetical protein K2173_013193 [Erythroxylum novogranatense]|uniref:Uncharacterized protein n=1 Tax=Erythroxylum novogranatense TaxID=1862640 RepID=A0AAV8THA0_9ROSI|nr:hypothetical protein K2173_013193 [Erythroxylum novogranatense]